MLNTNDRQRFWLCVPIYDEDKCWPWQGPIGPHGYGRFEINARLDTEIAKCPGAAKDRKVLYSQLLDYFAEHGVIPDFSLGKTGAENG